MHLIRLDNFEGPLDLLLHLLDQQKLEITEVSVAQVTDQYLEYVRAMETLDLDTVSEFAVMASRLLEIKARALLPSPPASEDDEDEGDPEAELVRRLLEYKQFKQAAELLRRQGEEAGLRFPRIPDDLANLEPQLRLEGLRLQDLLAAMEAVLAQASDEDDASLQLQRESLTVAGSMRRLMSELRREGGRVAFHQLFRRGSSRLEIVVTFLALLELLRRKRVKARQEAPFGPIDIILVPSSPEPSDPDFKVNGVPPVGDG